MSDERKITKWVAVDAPASPLIQLWILRALALLGGYKRMTDKNGLNDDEIAYALELGCLVEHAVPSSLPDIILVVLKTRLGNLESENQGFSIPEELSRNIEQLNNLVNLSKVERSILEFSILLHSENVLDQALNYLGDLTISRFYQSLAVLLNFSKKEIQTAFSTSGQLFQTGLLRLDRNGPRKMQSRIDLLGAGFAERMLSGEEDPIQLFMDSFFKVSAPQLTVDDYTHIEPKLRVLLPYLRHALNQKNQGVNVFVYGPPGSGKSQLARMLAHEVDANLFEVSSEDSDRDPINGEGRTPQTVKQLSGIEQLSPAVVSRAVRVIKAIRNEQTTDETSMAVMQLIDSTLIAQQHTPLKLKNANQLPEFYDTAFVNADVCLNEIADGIASTGSARLCLYGPPGTGKSAFGTWLADRLEKPLIVRKVSDLVSAYIGQTEKNLARAFREAEQENGVLLLDEVDSFLQDRRRASRSWEVTEVNEMLTQMESFGGVFVASTNLIDGLDQAALRRFDLKIKFDYLHAGQAWQLFLRHAEVLNLPLDEIREESFQRKLKLLTPGDFAVIARQSRFRPIKSAADMLSMLEVECGLKEDGKKQAIGFR